MTRDDLVAQTREIVDVWNAHDAPALARFYANGATVRDAADPDNPAVGQDAIVERARTILAGFSDAKLELNSLSIDGNRVCSEWRFSGTHDGVFLDAPASGQSLDNLGATVTQVDEDGKIVSENVYSDLSRFFRQIGALPASPATGAGS